MSHTKLWRCLVTERWEFEMPAIAKAAAVFCLKAVNVGMVVVGQVVYAGTEAAISRITKSLIRGRTCNVRKNSDRTSWCSTGSCGFCAVSGIGRGFLRHRSGAVR